MILRETILVGFLLHRPYSLLLRFGYLPLLFLSATLPYLSLIGSDPDKGLADSSYSISRFSLISFGLCEMMAWTSARIPLQLITLPLPRLADSHLNNIASLAWRRIDTSITILMAPSFLPPPPPLSVPCSEKLFNDENNAQGRERRWLFTLP